MAGDACTRIFTSDKIYVGKLHLYEDPKYPFVHPTRHRKEKKCTPRSESQIPNNLSFIQSFIHARENTPLVPSKAVTVPPIALLSPKYFNLY